jgi:hypothetical protein
MAIVQYAVVDAVSLLDLVEALRDQEGFDPIPGHEGERGFKKVQAAKRGKFVQHQQQAMALAGRAQILGQPAAHLVEDEPYEGFGAVDVGRRDDEIEADRLLAADQISNAPVAARCHARDDGIAVEAQKRHGGGQHAAAFVLALVQQLAGR